MEEEEDVAMSPSTLARAWWPLPLFPNMIVLNPSVPQGIPVKHSLGFRITTWISKGLFPPETSELRAVFLSTIPLL